MPSSAESGTRAWLQVCSLAAAGSVLAWWLPAANNIAAGYATTGTLVNMYGTPTNNSAGVFPCV